MPARGVGSYTSAHNHILHVGSHSSPIIPPGQRRPIHVPNSPPPLQPESPSASVAAYPNGHSWPDLPPLVTSHIPLSGLYVPPPSGQQNLYAPPLPGQNNTHRLLPAGQDSPRVSPPSVYQVEYPTVYASGAPTLTHFPQISPVHCNPSEEITYCNHHFCGHQHNHNQLVPSLDPMIQHLEAATSSLQLRISEGEQATYEAQRILDRSASADVSGMPEEDVQSKKELEAAAEGLEKRIQHSATKVVTSKGMLNEVKKSGQRGSRGKRERGEKSKKDIEALRVRVSATERRDREMEKGVADAAVAKVVAEAHPKVEVQALEVEGWVVVEGAEDVEAVG